MKSSLMTITCTAANRRPLAELQRLIEKRRKIIGESSHDATIATAITALVSIRSMTGVAKASRIKDRDIQVKDVTGSYIPGWSRNTGKPRRVLRIGGRHGAYLSGTPKNLLGGMGNVRNLVGPYVKGEQPRAFWARYSPPWQPVQGMQGGKVVQAKIGYFIAKTEAEVRSYLKKRIVKRIKDNAKLARNAISVAMGKMGRKANIDGGAKARVKASKMCQVHIVKSQNMSSVKFLDGLDYSLAAVKGGANGVDLALKKAANKIAGRIIRWASDNHLDSQGVESPFPEITRVNRSLAINKGGK